MQYHLDKRSNNKSNEYPMIDQKYHFLFDIISILNSKARTFGSGEGNLRYNLYNKLFAMVNEEQSK